MNKACCEVYAWRCRVRSHTREYDQPCPASAAATTPSPPTSRASPPRAHPRASPRRPAPRRHHRRDRGLPRARGPRRPFLQQPALRTEPMFGPAGTSYVYFTYGMHHCMNIAAADEGTPHAVLIRALEPTEGLGTMRAHRATPRRPAPDLRPADLCSGPAKLCQALAIDRSLTGLDLTATDLLWVEPPARNTTTGSGFHQIHTSPRIGVDYARAWARRHLRYFLCGHPHVSGRRTGGRVWSPSVQTPGGGA
ncbi:MAG: DNA-3-methyladenine glycosylase [Phycisphaerales bacterium]